MDRRQFGKLLAGAAALAVLPSEVEAKRRKKVEGVRPEVTPETTRGSYTFLQSSLSVEEMNGQKERAVISLRKSIPTLPELQYLHEHARNLMDESQMAIPEKDEVDDVVLKSQSELYKLAEKMEADEFGLFVFSDIGKDGKLIQRLYVLQKSEHGIEFLKRYLVSMADEGFGNKKGSGKTPFGLRNVESGKLGMFGEVLSGNPKYEGLFNKIFYKGALHWFVKGFGNEYENTTTDIVTDRYALDESRGIFIHGSNRSGERSADGTWKTLLGGSWRTNGCIGMSNTDIRDLGLSGHIWWPGSHDKKGIRRKKGTRVMIHATPEAISFLADKKNQGTNRPPRLGSKAPE